MSKIENFNRLQKISDECNRIIKNSDYGTLHYSRQEDVYHLVAFSFIIQGSNSHSYERSKELADYLGIACKEFKRQILERVLEIAKEKANEAKQAAKNEAM